MKTRNPFCVPIAKYDWSWLKLICIIYYFYWSILYQEFVLYCFIYNVYYNKIIKINSSNLINSKPITSIKQKWVFILLFWNLRFLWLWTSLVDLRSLDHFILLGLFILDLLRPIVISFYGPQRILYLGFGRLSDDLMD